MHVAPLKVVLDANVLFPFTLRDTLLRAAAAGSFQLHWTEQILEEAARNLVATGTISQDQAARLRTAMVQAFPEAGVTGYEHLIAAMPNEEKDRHVVAAAVKAGAQVIVTSNLRDFRALPEGVVSRSPDEFLCNLFELDPEAMVALIARQSEALKKPPRSPAELLRGLAKQAPRFARSVADHGGWPVP